MFAFFRRFDALRDRLRRRKWTEELANGARGEDIAMRFLQKRKFAIVDRNYRPLNGKGEIDIVAWDGETLVFVEVKSALDDERGSPDRAVDSYKRDRLENAARSYLHRARVEWERSRFDVLTVVGSGPNVRIEHYPGAF